MPRSVGQRRSRSRSGPIRVLLNPISPATPEPSPTPPQIASSSPETRSARPPFSNRLSELLDRAASSLPALWLIAFVLGASHAIQPGHGKTLVAATTLGERGRWSKGVVLAILTTLAHTGSVLAVAGVLWLTRSSRYSEINASLAHVAGFTIAAIGLWRLGRHLAGYGEHEETLPLDMEKRRRGLVGLGLAGGLVPCWDAILLIVLSEAMGKLALGIFLLSGFSLGMALVLVVVGIVATRVRGIFSKMDREGLWERRLGITGGLILSTIGLVLLVGP